MKLIKKLFTSKAIDQFNQHLHICTGKVNQTQLETPKVTGKILGRQLWEQERRSGLSCLKNVINVAAHSQAPEINMYSTTLISPYYNLNYGLWLSQALLNCDIHKLVKKLITEPLHLAICCSSYTTDSASLLLFSTKRVRKGEDPGGCGWVCAGAGHRGEMLERQFPSSSLFAHLGWSQPYHFPGGNRCKLDNHKHLRPTT